MSQYEEPWWRSNLSSLLSLKPWGTRYSYGNSNYGCDGRRRMFRIDEYLKNNPKLRTDDTPAPCDTYSGPLTVDSVDLLKDFNRENHPGSADYAENDVTDLVLRRGQTFQVTVTFNRPFDEADDTVSFQMNTGPKPSLKNYTLVPIPVVDEELQTNEWEAKKISSEASQVTFEIMIAADAVVGKYCLFVETKSKDGSTPLVRHKNNEEIYILFNAWCKEDTVYMEHEEERQEYVLNDQGLIYWGNKRGIRPSYWYFGQFESECLRAALHLLETSYLKKRAHGNPVLVLRALSAMANSNGGGVLTGNWSGNYGKKTSPTAWKGSHRILKQYMQDFKPVEFGQCWVFSGLLTTLCRTLGIPTRSVTNFESAHDSDFSGTIDQHVTDEGKPFPYFDDDSVWNFHVWNEAWLKRPDLPTGNDGWQAFDATPQESSDGMMRCGPAPVSAIKRGDVYLGYDALFIFAEVNGDRLTWQVGVNGDINVINIESGSIGRFISTKAVGKKERLDITDTYKHPEGSEEEREAVRKASFFGNRKVALADCAVYEQMPKDVSFEFKPDIKPTGDVDFTLTATNTSNETRTVNIVMNTCAKYYTGEPGDNIGEQHKGKLVLRPTEMKEHLWHVEATEWINSLAEDATIAIYVTATSDETGQVFNAIETIWLDKPDLKLTASAEEVKKNTAVDITVEFTNPLKVPLTNLLITLEGAGIEEKKIKRWKPVKPGEDIKEVVKVFPKRKGSEREVIASLNSRQLCAIEGHVTLRVVE